MIFIIVIFWIACAFYCGAVAGSKGHDNIPWFFGGLFFGVFALIAVAGLDDKELKSYVRKIDQIEDKVQNLNNKDNDDWEVLDDDDKNFTNEERTKTWEKISKKRNKEAERLRKLDEEYIKDMED
tara:strand:- start:377 stop:751 length:375 start_codon:yes stop_codon:yes gene_type:complete